MKRSALPLAEGGSAGARVADPKARQAIAWRRSATMPHGRRQGTHGSLPVERGAYGGCVIDSTSTAAISASRYRERRPALSVGLALIWRDRELATDERRVLRMTPTPDRLSATGTSRGPQRVSWPKTVAVHYSGGPRSTRGPRQRS